MTPELKYITKAGTVSLKSSMLNGKVSIDMLYNDEIIASFLVEFVWDFLGDVFQNNIPIATSQRWESSNYIDYGRRYNQSIAARLLANLLAPGSKSSKDTLAKIHAMALEDKT